MSDGQKTRRERPTLSTGELTTPHGALDEPTPRGALRARPRTRGALPPGHERGGSPPRQDPADCAACRAREDAPRSGARLSARGRRCRARSPRLCGGSRRALRRRLRDGTRACGGGGPGGAVAVRGTRAGGRCADRTCRRCPREGQLPGRQQRSRRRGQGVRRRARRRAERRDLARCRVPAPRERDVGRDRDADVREAPARGHDRAVRARAQGRSRRDPPDRARGVRARRLGRLPRRTSRHEPRRAARACDAR